MPMFPIEIPPGVVKKPTKASRSSNWREVNLIRWDNGIMKPVRGWQKLNYTPPASRVRQVHTWIDNGGIRWTAYLCEANLYVEMDGDLFDVSPEDPIVPPYQDVIAGGYGENAYSLNEYGTPRPPRNRIEIDTPIYTIDNWGEDLLVMTSNDGRLLRWSPATPTQPAVQVPDSPLGRTFVVTPERFVAMFAIDNVFNRWGWCDQENIENWNFADTASKAGFYDLQPASPFIAAKYIKDGILFATAAKWYIARYVGLPYIYNYEELGDGAAPFSAGSLVGTAVGALWPSSSGFWTYNGAAILPVECPLWDWVKDDFHEVYTRYEGFSANFSHQSEMWWFFCTGGSRYNNRYICYNYREGWWSQGRIGRSCGISSTIDTSNIAADGFDVYKHESGNSYPGAAELPWAETFTINVNSGALDMMLYQLLPDIEGDASGLRFRAAVRNRRAQISGNDGEVYTPRKAVRPNGYVDMRVSGRDFRLRIENVNPVVQEWTFGQTLVDFRARGKRTTIK